MSRKFSPLRPAQSPQLKRSPLAGRERHIPSPSKRLSSSQARSPSSSNAGSVPPNKQVALEWPAWEYRREMWGRGGMCALIHLMTQQWVYLSGHPPLPFTSQLLGQIGSTNVWGGERR